MRCYIDKVIGANDVATDIKLLIPDAALRRRMSSVIKMAVATAVEAMDGVDNIAELDAIITATGWGCLADSERFLRNVIVDDEQLLNPTPFIQSTFNTVGGQIALLRHNHCYNVTYVNRSHSFEDAMLDALMRFEDGESENILVGAFDEKTPSQHRIMERMGLFRKVDNGQGAMFAHLRAKPSDSSIAEVTLVDFPEHTLTREECMAGYQTTDDARLLYNTYAESGAYPTASAQCLVEAIAQIGQGASEVIIYNEYFGATPTILRVRCVG